MIEIIKASIDENIERQLIDLSKKWCDEKISFGLVPNTKEDLKEPCYIASDNNVVVGYIFGHYYKNEKKISCGEEVIKIGEDCFEVEELYVKKDYRQKGIGSKLYQALEKEVKDKVEFITLATSTKNYKEILKFYIEDNDMTFHSAFLFKKIK